MKNYKCECGETFSDSQKFNSHKGHCKVHFEAVGKNYSMDERIQKQKETIIKIYGSEEQYSLEHSKKIKEAFKSRTDTFSYIIQTIDKEEFIHDYIEENKPRTFMREKYNIPSDYMMDMIVKEFDCKKSKKQSGKLGWKTKYEIYPSDNMNNWRKGHETRAKNSGSVEASYRDALEKQKQTMLERYGTECILNDASLVTHRKKKMTEPNIRFAKLLEKSRIPYEQEFVVGTKSYDFKINDTLVEIDPTPTHNSYHLPYPPYNGLDINYHSLKTKLAIDNNYRCIHVWDWDNLDKIISLLQSREKIYARSCEVKIISKDEAKDLCSKYHLQDYAKSSVHIGLFSNEKLVSVMTFDRPRYNKNYQWELIRFCSSCAVVGGSEKLFKFFIDNYLPISVISYCDLSKFTGNTYEKLNFKRESVSQGRHWYNIKTGVHITDNLLRQRGFDQLLGDTYGCFGKGTSNEELMYINGFVDIYDCGQARYVWHN